MHSIVGVVMHLLTASCWLRLPLDDDWRCSNHVRLGGGGWLHVSLFEAADLAAPAAEDATDDAGGDAAADGDHDRFEQIRPAPPNRRASRPIAIGVAACAVVVVVDAASAAPHLAKVNATRRRLPAAGSTGRRKHAAGTTGIDVTIATGARTFCVVIVTGARGAGSHVCQEDPL